MNNQIYHLENIGVCYKKGSFFPWKQEKFWALKQISFDVFRGQTLGIIGRNGAGKSTLLKILAGIILPDTGIIHREQATVTMQSLGAGFDPRLTGRQNIILNGLLLGMKKKQIAQRTNEIIKLADLGDFIDKPIRHYSNGMRARLGFSIAYFVDTDIILIDEALATGDQAFRAKASEMIKKKIKSNHTVILVTHNMSLVRELCDRVIEISNGYSLPEYPVQQTIKRYQDIQQSRKLVLESA